MTLDPRTYSAFNDELTKIGGVGKAMGNLIRRGWDDIGGVTPQPRRMLGLRAPKKIRGEGWLGKQDTWRRNLPVGGKSLAVGATAAMIPGTLRKEDPLGQERSRTERAADLTGETVGGLMGAGAALSLPGKRFGLLRSVGGAIGGSLLGSRMAATPWRRAREAERKPVLSPQERQRLFTQNVAR